MTLRITQANVSGFTGDNEVIEVIDPEQVQFFIPAAVELFDTFSIDLIFEAVYGDPLDPSTLTYEYVSDVRDFFDWSSIGLTYTKLNDYSIRLSGTASNIFTDQFYRFKLTDYTEQNLSADTELPFFGLIQYKMPNPTTTFITFPFEADYPTTPSSSTITTEQFGMVQQYFWRFQVALANIAAANERGLK
jgi:hypothetical protein